MGEMFGNISRQEADATLSVRPGRDERVQMLREFLIWLDKSRGLTLCRAFKPEYDWYMNAFADTEALAHEFLVTRCNREATK